MKNKVNVFPIFDISALYPDEMNMLGAAIIYCVRESRTCLLVLDDDTSLRIYTRRIPSEGYKLAVDDELSLLVSLFNNEAELLSRDNDDELAFSETSDSVQVENVTLFVDNHTIGRRLNCYAHFIAKLFDCLIIGIIERFEVDEQTDEIRQEFMLYYDEDAILEASIMWDELWKRISD